MEWDEINAGKQEKIAYYKNLGKKRCLSCGLYGCICQTTLEEY